MHAELLVPALLLGFVFCVALVLLREDTRRRQLARQLKVAVDAGRKHTPSPEAQRRIRRDERGQGGLLALLHRVFGYQPDGARLWPVSRTAVAGGLAGVVLYLLARLVLSAWLSLPVGLAGGVFAIRMLFAWQRRRYADRLLRQMPDAIQLAVGAVRAGMPMAEAFRILSRETPEPTRDEFLKVADELALGVPVDNALLDIWRRTGVREYAIFSMTLSVQNRSGGQLAETIQILGDTVRARIGIAGRAKALAGEATMSAQVIGGLPVVMAGVLSLIRPDYLSPLLHDPRGRMMLAYAVFSWLAGVLTMRWMIRKGTAV